jgi:hypothetical protein
LSIFLMPSTPQETQRSIFSLIFLDAKAPCLFPHFENNFLIWIAKCHTLLNFFLFLCLFVNSECQKYQGQSLTSCPLTFTPLHNLRQSRGPKLKFGFCQNMSNMSNSDLPLFWPLTSQVQSSTWRSKGSQFRILIHQSLCFPPALHLNKYHHHSSNCWGQLPQNHIYFVSLTPHNQSINKFWQPCT